jgi:hypothetical protein
MMYNEQRFEEFSKAYHAGLDEAVQMFPQEYAYPREKVPAVAEKMLTAIKTSGPRSKRNVRKCDGCKRNANRNEPPTKPPPWPI